MPVAPRRLRFIVALLLVALPPPARMAAAAAGKSSPTTAPAKEDARRLEQRVESLRRTALGPDPAASDAAIGELKEIGEPARKALAGALQQVLARDKALIRRAGASSTSAKKLKEALDRLAEARKDANDNLKELDKGESLKRAHDDYATLARLTKEVNDYCAAADPIVGTLAVRPFLVAAYREADPAAAARECADADETKLRERAEAVLGISAAAMADIPAFARGQPAPGEDAPPLVRQLWFWRACRQVEAYNATLARGLLNYEERDNLRLLNAYRESLGLLPLELDARLVQAARRHSKEMTDLRYFDHTSPTPSERTFRERIRNAGYNWRYAGENIAFNFDTGDKAFWGWFDSPGHHRQMIDPRATSIGVGKWGRNWTQNFGSSRAGRLMFLSEEERKAVTVKGDVLRPQR